MFFDNLSDIMAIDSQNTMTGIKEFPSQLYSGWKIGKEINLALKTEIKAIIFVGVGEEVLAAEIAVTYASKYCRTQFFICNDYEIPVWAASEETLVVAVALQGDPEEVVSVIQQAIKQQCKLAVFTGRGSLLYSDSQELKYPSWIIEQETALPSKFGLALGLCLGLFENIGLIESQQVCINESIQKMNQLAQDVGCEIPAVKNFAKRMAGQMMNRINIIVASGVMRVVAKRMKTQLNRYAKAWSFMEVLPEFNHDAMAGIFFPEEISSKIFVIFIKSEFNHPRNELRSDLSKEALMVTGIGTDEIVARGDTLLTQLCTSLLFVDYIAYYLAIAYQVDPAHSETISEFEETIRNISL
jgi:glucose/mannose-6-phosphate isomerase